MTIGERIKKLRKELTLTQKEFADRLKLSRSNIATYEVGKNNPADAVINLICREFNVSEMWLRTGEGEIFMPAPSGALDAFIRERGLTPADRVLIDKFAALDAMSRQAVVDYVLAVADTIQPSPLSGSGKDICVTPSLDAAGKQRAEADTNGQERKDADIAAELAELKQQNQKLAAEIAAIKEEDALKEAAAELPAEDTFNSTKVG